MPTTLQSRLSHLALSFSESVLDAIRGASIEELFGDAGSSRRGAARGVPATRPGAPVAAAAEGGRRRRGGRLPRRTASDIASVVADIVSLLSASPGGLRAEQIRTKLGLQAKELPRPLHEALASGRLGKSGQKRATTYFVKVAAKSAPPAKGGSGGGGGRRGRRAGAKKAAPKRGRARGKAAKAAPAATST